MYRDGRVSTATYISLNNCLHDACGGNTHNLLNEIKKIKTIKINHFHGVPSDAVFNSKMETYAG